MDGPATHDWDYSTLAQHYERRAPYHLRTADVLLANLPAPVRAVDLGAGTGRVARALATHGAIVQAVEPCAPMAVIGRDLARVLPADALAWHDATAERTGLPDASADLCTFGSSFNVVDAASALAECARLLVPGGRLACLWNHRDLDDPLQREIEAAVRLVVPGFRAGARRDDPTPAIVADGRFAPLAQHALAFVHETSAGEFVDGFRAHATLLRQAGEAADAVLAVIAGVVARAAPDGVVRVPFVTRVWLYAKA